MAKIWFDDALDLNSLTENGGDCMPGYVGIRFIDYGDDWIKASMPVNERTKQPYGRLHGGASVALAETLGSLASYMMIDPETQICVGTSIQANHIRPGTSGFAHGKASLIHKGRTTHIWNIDITNDEGKMLCACRLTMAILPK